MVLFKRTYDLRRGKNLFDACLRVVKIPPNATHINIFALLGNHLVLLHGAYAVLRIKNNDFCAVYILKPFQCGLARVAGSRNKYDRFLPLTGFSIDFVSRCGKS